MDPFGAYAIASATITITGPAALQFTTQPGGAQVGQPLAPQPVVRVVDTGGNVVPAYTGPVTIGFGTNAGAANLGGTATVNAVNGVATFTDRFVNAAGNGYTLVATSGTLAVLRQGPGPVHVAFVVIDICGEWPPFVGGGPGAS
jgi:hypothetical protein